MTVYAPASTGIRSLRTSILWLVSSTGAGHLLSFASAPLLIALYAPESVGAFALLSIAASLTGNISAMRYERAIVLARKDDDARLMVRACFVLNALAGAALLSGILVLHYFFGQLGELSPLQTITATLLTTAFGTNQTLTHWLTRCGRFSKVAMADLSLTLVMISLQLLLGLVGSASAESLLGSMLIGRIVATVLMYQASDSLGLTERRHLSDLRRLLHYYRTLPLYSTPNAVVGMLQFRVLLFLVAHFSGLADAGRLAIAYRLTYVPAAAFGTALRRVFFPKFSCALVERSTKRLALTMLTFLGVVVPPAVIGCSLLLSSAGTLLPLEWQASVAYVQCLLPIAAVMVFTSWFDQVYDVLHRQRSALVLESAAALVGVGLFCAFSVVGASTVTALAAYAAWIFAYNIAWLGITWQMTKWPQSHFWRALAAISVYAIVLCLAFPLQQGSALLALGLLLGVTFAARRRFSDVTQWIGRNDDFGYRKVA
jgi:stage V sporulation protein B